MASEAKKKHPALKQVSGTALQTTEDTKDGRGGRWGGECVCMLERGGEEEGFTSCPLFLVVSDFLVGQSA